MATMAASITAACLDAALLDDKAFLPKRIQRWLNKGRDPSDMVLCKRWRSILDDLILSLADQQLVTGLALMVGGYVKLHAKMHSAHFWLIVYMCCLSSSSHIACIVTLRKYMEDHPVTSYLRICLVVIFAVMLVTSIIIAGAVGPSLLFFILIFDLPVFFPFIEQALTYVPIVWLFFTAVLEVAPFLRQKIKSALRKHMWPSLKRTFRVEVALDQMCKRLPSVVEWYLRKTLVACFWYLLLLTPCSIWILQVAFALLSATLTLAQKFAKPGSPREGMCTLSSSDENAWGFGQLLPMFLLWLPLLSAFEAYVGE